MYKAFRFLMMKYQQCRIRKIYRFVKKCKDDGFYMDLLHALPEVHEMQEQLYIYGIKEEALRMKGEWIED
jgi:hypothetical protein